MAVNCGFSVGDWVKFNNPKMLKALNCDHCLYIHRHESFKISMIDKDEKGVIARVWITVPTEIVNNDRRIGVRPYMLKYDWEKRLNLLL